jgi:hypothetical protein
MIPNRYPIKRTLKKQQLQDFPEFSAEGFTFTFNKAKKATLRIDSSLKYLLKKVLG